MPRLAAATNATRSFSPKSMSVDCLSLRLCASACIILTQRRPDAKKRGLSSRPATAELKEAGIDQSPRIVVINNPRLGLLLKSSDEPFDFIRNSTGTNQTADHFPFVIRDCEFVQGANRPGNEQHHVA